MNLGARGFKSILARCRGSHAAPLVSGLGVQCWPPPLSSPQRCSKEGSLRRSSRLHSAAVPTLSASTRPSSIAPAGRSPRSRPPTHPCAKRSRSCAGAHRPRSHPPPWCLPDSSRRDGTAGRGMGVEDVRPRGTPRAALLSTGHGWGGDPAPPPPSRGLGSPRGLSLFVACVVGAPPGPAVADVAFGAYGRGENGRTTAWFCGAISNCRAAIVL